MKYKKYNNKYEIKILTSVYDAHKNNDKRVIGIAQLCLSAVLKMGRMGRKSFNVDVHLADTYSLHH